ncbi:hypothetical protein [Bacteroides helcogenes]|uniref:HU domain-containing protein n=1 Tax=Bacteroides helcogenes (strain ATCC 35417 / DSM 20613 / JCM 6297 / CCUG 15421 / P 36-108) TaxID=693979 RepID=E6SQW9_BACT6|nr:hypothetical protein [Bacteroides helcogenes]ADV45038.1 hypothetical protein Bache_3111 [Bacteroides helcogenes P 36-108]MDY5239896.1 hypothetical protein [Bacteroides helcogenes]
MQNYKLVKRGNPAKKDAPKKWYAIPVSYEAQNVKTMTRAATENTTTAPFELESALELLGNYAKQQLLQGHIVRIGSLGTLRITFKSEGVDDINQFNAGQMIKEARVLFTPSKELRESVVKGLQYQNGGVLEDGISYTSLSDYKRAKGSATGGGGTVTPPSGGGDENENPLG